MILNIQSFVFLVITIHLLDPKEMDKMIEASESGFQDTRTTQGKDRLLDN